MREKSNTAVLTFKMEYPGLEAYHFPVGQSSGFPWEHPDYKPREVASKVIKEE